MNEQMCVWKVYRYCWTENCLCQSVAGGVCSRFCTYTYRIDRLLTISEEATSACYRYKTQA